MTKREWFYNPACDWYDGPPVIEVRDGQKYLIRIPHMEYYNGTTNIPKVERVKKANSAYLICKHILEQLTGGKDE